MAKIQRLCSMIGAAILSTSLATPANAQSKTRVRPFVEALLLGSYRIHSCEVLSVPEAARNVPIHPDDTYVPQSSAGPLPDGKIGCGSWGGNVRLGLGLGLHNKILDLSGGVILSSANSVGGQNLAERNYTNDVGGTSRGYGAALTFYDKSLNHKPESIGYLVRASRTISSDDDGRLKAFAEVSTRQDSYSMRTGWDRYNSLQTWKDFQLFDVSTKQISVGFDMLYANLAGMRFSIDFYDPTAEIKLGTNSNYRFRRSVGASFGFVISNF